MQTQQDFDITKVPLYYDIAFPCYQETMGELWHHPLPDAMRRGLSILESKHAIIEKIVSLSGMNESTRVMDFGCGIAGPTRHMARVSGATILGVSNHAPTLAHGRKRNQEEGLSHLVTLEQLDNDEYLSFRYPGESFDIITFYDCVCCLPDKAGFFKELFRLLKPGGRVCGMDWLQRPWGRHQTQTQMDEVMREVNDSFVIPWHGTIEQYKAMLGDAGFEVRIADDLWPNEICAGDSDPDDALWYKYEGAAADVLKRNQSSLEYAKKEGVFTVGLFLAQKP